MLLGEKIVEKIKELAARLWLQVDWREAEVEFRLNPFREEWAVFDETAYEGDGTLRHYEGAVDKNGGILAIYDEDASASNYKGFALVVYLGGVVPWEPE